MTCDRDAAKEAAVQRRVPRIADEISPFIVMDVMERAQELERRGRRIIHLEVGEPDYDTPEAVKEAALRALREGKTHYTSSLGLPELREEISRYYSRTYGVQVDPNRVIVTSGTSPGLLLALFALLDPGDEVILSDPRYACYPNTVRIAGGIPVHVPLKEENGFRFEFEALRGAIGPRTKAIIVNSPSNPTGIVLPPEDLERIAGLGVTIISDEIYHGLVYGEKAHSMLEFTRDCVVVNGFSKLYAMTGWRLGWVVVPDGLMRVIQKLQQNLFICASSVAQYAGIAALRECGEFVERMVATYDARRKYMVKRLREVGLGVSVEPTGAFYVLANARAFAADSYSLAFDILEKVGVAVTPGIDFGANAEGYLRFSYANSIENIEEGMRRLADYFQERGANAP